MRALLYARLSAAHLGRQMGTELASLRKLVTSRGWSVEAEFSDTAMGIAGRRDGLARLVAAIQAKRADVVVVNGLALLFRGARHFVELGGLIRAQGLDLVAVDESFDTTSVRDRIRWEAALDLLADLTRRQRSEAAKVSHVLAAAGRETWGRPAALINPLELRDLWEGREGKRPGSVREIARKLDVGATTVRKHIRILLEEGKLDQSARDAALAEAGGLRRGGRPRKKGLKMTPELEERLIEFFQGRNPRSMAVIAELLGTTRHVIAQEVQRLRAAGRINDAARAEHMRRGRTKN